jgi:hypothetical protein
MNLASSISVSKAWAAFVGGTQGPACCWDAVRSAHVGDCQSLDPGCSKRRAIVPSSEGVGMKSP